MTVLVPDPTPKVEFNHDPFTVPQLFDCVFEHYPELGRITINVRPVISREVPVMGVDKHWRLFINPLLLAGKMRYSFHEACGILVHELWHLLCQHHSRADALGVGEREDYRQSVNIAMDAAINDLIHRDLQARHERTKCPIVLPDDAYRYTDIPEGIQYDAWETHFRKLLAHLREQLKPDPQGHVQGPQTPQGQADPGSATGPQGPDVPGPGTDPGQGSQPGDANQGPGDSSGSADQSQGGKPGESGSTGIPGENQGQGSGGLSTADQAKLDRLAVEAALDALRKDRTGQDERPKWGGSAGDGIKRPWEEGEPLNAKDLQVGGDPDKAYDLVKEIANKAWEANQGDDGLGAALKEVADVPVTVPNVFEQLRQQIRAYSGLYVRVGDERSYKRISRRYHTTGVLQPTGWTIQPNVVFIIDTSGSMRARDIAIAKRLLKYAIQHFRTDRGLTVVTGDTRTRAVVRQVLRPEQIELRGGGGTDMGKLIREAYENAKGTMRPEVIVVVTDGVTGWPRKKLPVPVIACVTRPLKGPRHTDSIGRPSHMVPDWMLLLPAGSTATD